MLRHNLSLRRHALPGVVGLGFHTSGIGVFQRAAQGTGGAVMQVLSCLLIGADGLLMQI